MNESPEAEPHKPPHLPAQPTPPPPPLPPPAFSTFPHQQKNSLGVWAIVLGILSILCCGFLTGVPAIPVGRASERAQAEGLASNGNLGRVGWILGIIGSALWLLMAAIYVLAFLFPTLLFLAAVPTY